MKHKKKFAIMKAKNNSMDQKSKKLRICSDIIDCIYIALFMFVAMFPNVVIKISVLLCVAVVVLLIGRIKCIMLIAKLPQYYREKYFSALPWIWIVKSAIMMVFLVGAFGYMFYLTIFK